MRLWWIIPVVCILCATAWFLCGYRKEDPTHGRLEHTISELKTMGAVLDWEVNRRDAQIAGLAALDSGDFDRPHVVYAACLTHRGAGFTFVGDYVDIQPRASFFRVYGKSGHFVDLTEEEPSRQLNLRAAQTSVLYSAVWIWDSANAPQFGHEEEAYVEIHNLDGAISPRVQIRMLPYQGGVERGT